MKAVSAPHSRSGFASNRVSGQTIHVEPENESVAWAEIFPKMLAAIAR